MPGATSASGGVRTAPALGSAAASHTAGAAARDPFDILSTGCPLCNPVQLHLRSLPFCTGCSRPMKCMGHGNGSEGCGVLLETPQQFCERCGKQEWVPSPTARAHARAMGAPASRTSTTTTSSVDSLTPAMQRPVYQHDPYDRNSGRTFIAALTRSSYVHPGKYQGGSTRHSVELKLLDRNPLFHQESTEAADVEMMCAAAEQPHPWKHTVAGYPIVAMYCDQELMGVLRVVEVAEGPAFTWNWKKNDMTPGAEPKRFPPALRENAIIRGLLFGVEESPALKGLTTAHGGQLVITGSHDNHTAQTIAKLVVWSCKQDQAAAGGYARDPHLHKRIRIDENEPSVVTVEFPAGLLGKLRTFVGGNFNVVKSKKNARVRQPGTCFDEDGGAAEAANVIGALAATKLLSG